MVLEDWVDRFTFWEGIHPDVQTMLIFGIGIAVYTVLVFTFYQNLSQRTPYHSKPKPGAWGRTIHFLENIFVFPMMSFGYFIVLALSLFLLAKTQSTGQILLLSMSVVVGVRVTAFVSDLASVDLAKLLPWSLFAVLLVDPGFLSLATTFGRVSETVQMAPVLFQYFVLFIVIEGVLRGVHKIFPGVQKLTKNINHKRKLSKKAMLRDVESEHEGTSLFHHSHHDHAPRDKTHGGEFIALDEHSGGKPGSRQGAGPALPQGSARGRAPQHASGATLKHETRHTARAESNLHAPTPRAGPGGKGGNLGSW
jgi:uncharacterized membrane protein